MHAKLICMKLDFLCRGLLSPLVAPQHKWNGLCFWTDVCGKCWCGYFTSRSCQQLSSSTFQTAHKQSGSADIKYIKDIMSFLWLRSITVVSKKIHVRRLVQPKRRTSLSRHLLSKMDEICFETKHFMMLHHVNGDYPLIRLESDTIIIHTAYFGNAGRVKTCMSGTHLPGENNMLMKSKCQCVVLLQLWSCLILLFYNSAALPASQDFVVWVLFHHCDSVTGVDETK